MPRIADAELVGFAGARFAVIDTTAGALVYDSESNTGFGVYGHPIHAAVETWDIWLNVGFQGGILRSRVEVSAGGQRMLVRTEHGIQAVDLSDRGALLAGWRGVADGASIAPDGETFAAWTDHDVTFVRISDGARVSYPVTRNKELALQWTQHAASWMDATGAHLVNRATWNVQNAAIPFAETTMSKDGNLAVVHRGASEATNDAPAGPGVVEVWRSGETRPAARIASPFVGNVIIDDTASKVAWVEYSGTMESLAHLHTLDLASGVHLRFASKATNCTLTHERLLKIENGELHTDAECSPGCPSITREPDFIAYDVTSGRLLRRWQGPVEPPFNDELGARAAVAERLAKHYAFDRNHMLPAVHHPSAGVIVVERPDGLRVVDDVAFGGIASLDNSADFSSESVHFWPESGVRMIGVRDGSVAVWDPTTGQRVWSSRP